MNPERLRYTEDHVWIGEQDGLYVVGITDVAQEQMGDITYVELPSEGQDLEIGEDACVIEAMQATNDVYIYSPVAGRVTEINHVLEDAPEKINQDPYGSGWFFKLEGVDAEELSDLMDAKGYKAYCVDHA